MRSIMKNTALIFGKNKEFIGMITFQPVLIFLLMSFLLSYSTTHKIAVINQDAGYVGNEIEDSLARMEGIELVEIAQEDLTGQLIMGAIELAVVIDEANTALLEETKQAAVQLVLAGESEIEETVRAVTGQVIAGVLEGDADKIAEVRFQVNEVKEKGISISNSLGFMIFKLVGGASLLAELLVNERRNKMRDRILLSGVGINRYLGGMGSVYLAGGMLGSVIFYAASQVLNFDLGMRQPIGFLLMLFVVNILSVTLFLFASTLVNSASSLWVQQSFILMPVGLLSGALFPFDLMPEMIRKLANCLPYRWIISGIEQMQRRGSIAAASRNMAMVLGLSVLLYAAAIIRTRRLMRRSA